MAVTFHQKSGGNAASTTLSSGVTNTDTSFPLTSDTAFLAGGGLVIVDEGESTEELAYYTGKSGGALTVPLSNRGLEGGSAQGHAAGATVKAILSADMWNNVIETLANGFSATDGAVDTTKVVTPTTLASSTVTFTNKRITSRVQSVTDAATVTPNADSDDCVDITAIAQAFTIANPSGTPTNFQKLIIRIKDNGTARAITWGSGYVAGGTALPSTTVLSKILNLGFIYNTANSLNKWQLVASAQEA